MNSAGGFDFREDSVFTMRLYYFPHFVDEKIVTQMNLFLF